MPLRKIASALLLSTLMLCIAWPAAALQQPRPVATDSRIRTVRFSENEVYQFIGHYGFVSTIEFAPDEDVKTVIIGDSVAWMVNPGGNRIFLKPVEQNALTNMTVITSKRTYMFELHAEETKNVRDKELVFTLRFIYPQNELADAGVVQYEEMPEIEKHPEKYNLNYTIRGSSLIEPLRIFDDGAFTYMEFRDKNADVPAIFRVNSNLEEELINFRKRGNYIVVERVASRFTLRRGGDILCVYNENLPMHITPDPPKTLLQRVRDFHPF